MSAEFKRTVCFIPAEHTYPLRAVQRANRVKFERLVLITEDQEFVARAKQYFSCGEEIIVLPIGSSPPAGSFVVEPNGEDAFLN